MYPNFNQQPFNFGTQPAMPYLPNYTPQQPQQNIVQPASSNVNWIYVNGMDGAKSQIVQPGATGWMMDNNEPVIYVKTVDNMGTASLKAFRLTEISTSERTMDDSTYVKKDDMDGILSRIKALEDVISEIK